VDYSCSLFSSTFKVKPVGQAICGNIPPVTILRKAVSLKWQKLTVGDRVSDESMIG
jgi:hypothetical protein